MNLESIYVGPHALDRWRERVGAPRDCPKTVKIHVLQSEALKPKQLLRWLRIYHAYSRASIQRLRQIAAEEAARGMHWRRHRQLGAMFLVGEREGGSYSLVTCLLRRDVMARAKHARQWCDGK